MISDLIWFLSVWKKAPISVFLVCLFIFTDPNIENEQAELAEKRLHLACEAFGGGTLPQLQSATYNVPEACVYIE